MGLIRVCVWADGGHGHLGRLRSVVVLQEAFERRRYCSVPPFASTTFASFSSNPSLKKAHVAGSGVK